MSNKIFICGRVYELTATNTAAITNKIQKRIDSFFDTDDRPNVRLVEFSILVTQLPNSNEQDIVFTFKRNNIFAKEGVNPELINDSDCQLTMGMYGGFKPDVMWELVEPFAFGRYHVPIFEFIPAYVGTAQAKGASEIKGMQIESSKTELKLMIRV